MVGAVSDVTPFADLLSKTLLRVEKSLEQDRVERADLTKSIKSLAAAVTTLSDHLRISPVPLQPVVKDNFFLSRSGSNLSDGITLTAMTPICDAQTTQNDLPGVACVEGAMSQENDGPKQLTTGKSLVPASASHLAELVPEYVQHTVIHEKGEVLHWLPLVEAAAKITRVSNVETGSMSFSVDFILYMDWQDPNLQDYDGDLAALDWGRKFFNPEVTIKNATDGGDFIKGADSIPRWYPSKNDPDRWLRKTARYRGELFMDEADLRCFPFDVQMLPIHFESHPCRPLLKFIRNENGSTVSKDACKFIIQSSSRLLSDKDYLQAGLKGCGSFLTSTAGNLLVEFQAHAVSAHTDPQNARDFQVNIVVRRPVMGSYTFSLLNVTVMTGIACTSFWADLVVSGRISITLTVILTIAVGTRPDCICKIPYITFFDRCMQVSLLIGFWISFANILTVSRCGGFEESQTPIFMQDAFYRSGSDCDVSWCDSTGLDCRFFLLTLAIWTLALGGIIWLVYRRRERIWAKVKKEASQPRFLSDFSRRGSREFKHKDAVMPLARQ